jgi:hypothetical protein
MFIYTAQLRESEENDSFCSLPDEIQILRDGIQSKQQEIDKHYQQIIDQILEISQVNRKPVLYKPFSNTEQTLFLIKKKSDT